MWYQWLDKKNNIVGWYQCDVVDFKKMWKVVKDEISSCLVKLDNGKCWLYVKSCRKDKYVGYNGWSEINNIVGLKNKENYK